MSDNAQWCYPGKICRSWLLNIRYWIVSSRLFHPLTLILNSFIQNICSLLYSELGRSVLIEVYKEHSCLVTKNYNLFANKILLLFCPPHSGGNTMVMFNALQIAPNTNSLVRNCFNLQGRNSIHLTIWHNRLSIKNILPSLLLM